ncbi:MAG: hypothetical protein Q7S76_01990 [bacterium]|nr:hypothetical protein [bacterium]
MSPEKIVKNPETSQDIERKRRGSEAIRVGSRLLEDQSDATTREASRKLRIIADELEQSAPIETPEPRTYRSQGPPGPGQGVEQEKS